MGIGPSAHGGEMMAWLDHGDQRITPLSFEVANWPLAHVSTEVAWQNWTVG